MYRAWKAWLRERLPWLVFVPVISALTLAASWTAEAPTVRVLARVGALMTMSVIQFRLWDDLADRAHDARFAPTRVIVRAGVHPFLLPLASLTIGACAIAWWLGGAGALVLVLALDAAAVAGYGVIRPFLADSVWRLGVLLLKYPMFITIGATCAGTPQPRRLWLAGLAAYGVSAAYEIAHTQIEREERAS